MGQLDFDDLLKQAISSYKVGNVEEARRLLASILTISPTHPDANHNMGLLYIGSGEIKAALPFFKVALEARSDVAQFWYSYVDALIKDKDFSSARTVLNQARVKGAKGRAFDELELTLSKFKEQPKVKGDPSPSQLQPLLTLYNEGKLQAALFKADHLVRIFSNSAFLYNLIGVLNAGLGNYETSINNYRQALKLKPNFVDAYCNMGHGFKAYGNLNAASKSYNNALKLDQRNIEATASLAAVLMEQGDLEASVETYLRALNIEPNDVGLRYNLGNVLKLKGDIDGAIESYERAVLINPNYVDAYNNMGLAFVDSGNPIAAIDCFKNAISINPKYSEAYNNLGLAYVEIGDISSAVGSYKKALENNLNSADAYHNLGIALVEQGELKAAVDCYEKAIEIKPKFPSALNNLGLTLMNMGMFDSAIVRYQNAIEIQPDYAPYYNNIGLALVQNGELDKSIECFKKALKIDPNSFEAFNNIGVFLYKSDDLKGALDYFQRALAIKPHYADAHFNIGIILAAQGKVEDAISSYMQVIEISTDHIDAHINYAHGLLMDHQFELGFAEHEWRWKRAELKIGAVLDTSKPMWEGKHNQTVFVWREQGIGDEIMFASLIADLRAVSSKVIVECEPRLIALFERSFPKNITFVSDRSSVNEDMYDFHISMGSLSRFFRPSVESFNEKNHKYLCADPVRAETLRRNLLKGEDKKLVGISWKTASNVPNAQDRNISLSDIAQVLNKPGIQLVSLQYGDVADEISNLKTEFGISVTQVSEVDNKNDIDGLASLISACDEVVSTTNVTVHLAGALGADVSVLLPFVPRWIWGKPNSPSTWYRSVKPYRQSAAGEWDNVLKPFKTPN